MSKWFYINAMVVILVCWKLSISSFQTHILFGFFGSLFVLYNWTRHAFFSTIRSNKSRKKKIAFAKVSKKALPLHKWTGTTALLLILIHATLVISHFGVMMENVKWWSGILAGGTLVGVVLAGWLRYIKTTLFRRYLHWGLAFGLFFFMLLHVLL